MRFLVCSWPDNPDRAHCPFEKALELREDGQPSSHLPVIIRWEEADGPGAEAGGTPAETARQQGVVPLEVMERELVARAMKLSGDNQTHASELLGITRDQLRYRLKKFGIQHEHDAA